MDAAAYGDNAATLGTYLIALGKDPFVLLSRCVVGVSETGELALF